MNRCETCAHYVHGECTIDKIDEEIGQSQSERVDMLIYCYNEGGSFYPGPRFGCVHHEPLPDDVRS